MRVKAAETRWTGRRAQRKLDAAAVLAPAWMPADGARRVRPRGAAPPVNLQLFPQPLLFALLLGAGCHGQVASESAPPASALACPAHYADLLRDSAQTIAVDTPKPGELHRVFELPDSPALWQPATTPETTAYRRAAAARLDGHIAPRELLERQLALYSFAQGSADAANMRAVLGGTGTLEPASCLDVLLWREQARRFPMLEHATEFGAFILRRAGVVRIYHSGADRVGQKLRSEVTDRVRADVAQGFEFVAHLHNHPFLFDRQPGDRLWTTPETVGDVAGAVAPSTNDVRVYQQYASELRLQQAWVTNGLDTLRIRAADLGKLAAAAP